MTNDSIIAGPPLHLAALQTPADPIAAHPLVMELSRPKLDITIEPKPYVPLWQDGLEAQTRPVGIGDNSAVLALVCAIIAAVMLGHRHLRTVMRRLWGGLRGMRSRGNAFDEHTSAERQMLVLMALQWCLCTALLAYSAIAAFLPAVQLPTSDAFAHTGTLMALMAVYYIFQLAAYSTVGYTFADPSGRRLFVGAFISTQAMASFAMVVPALLAIFYPVAAIPAIWAGAGLYILARITFVIKGFKIFYTNFISLLYFILYLCTLEIIPLIGVAFAAVWLVTVV